MDICNWNPSYGNLKLACDKTDSWNAEFAEPCLLVTNPFTLLRSISSFNASRELPSNVEDSLILWLNKVSEAVCLLRKEETTALLLDPDPTQRRRNKAKLMNQPGMRIPRIDQLGAGIADGQCLAALILHYHQDSAKPSGIACSCYLMSYTWWRLIE